MPDSHADGFIVLQASPPKSGGRNTLGRQNTKVVWSSRKLCLFHFFGLAWGWGVSTGFLLSNTALTEKEKWDEIGVDLDKGDKGVHGSGYLDDSTNTAMMHFARLYR